MYLNQSHKKDVKAHAEFRKEKAKSDLGNLNVNLNLNKEPTLFETQTINTLKVDCAESYEKHKRVESVWFSVSERRRVQFSQSESMRVSAST